MGFGHCSIGAPKFTCQWEATSTQKVGAEDGQNGDQDGRYKYFVTGEPGDFFLSFAAQKSR